MEFIYHHLRVSRLLPYEEGRKVKIVWEPAICAYTDLIYSLLDRLICKKLTKNSAVTAKDFLKIPKLGRKYRINLLVRVYIQGYTLVKVDPSARPRQSQEFELNFFIELKAKDLDNEVTPKWLLEDLINQANKQFANQIPDFDPKEYLMYRFEKIVTDFRYKVLPNKGKGKGKKK